MCSDRPFPPLGLPPIAYQLKRDRSKLLIFDTIRRKYVVLTPEEWVRQHFVSFLIGELNYPRALFSVERGLTYNALRKRSDILVYNQMGCPWMLIECKSCLIKLAQSALNQVLMYNMSIKARYLVVTNGMVYYCWDTFDIGKEQHPKLLKKLPSFTPA